MNPLPRSASAVGAFLLVASAAAFASGTARGALAATDAVASPPVAERLAIPRDAQALIDLHVVWLGGWAAVDGLQDFALSGTLAVSGLSGSLTMRSRRAGQSLLEYDLGVIAGAEAVIGEGGASGGGAAGGWERNASGQIEPLAVDKVSRLLRENDRAFLAHLRGKGVAVSLAGPIEKEGSAGTLLRFDYPDGDRFELLVDPRSGESIWSRTVTDGRETWTRLGDFRVLQGVRFAARQESFAEHAAENQVVEWREMSANVGLAAKLFARPAAGERLARITGGVAGSPGSPGSPGSDTPAVTEWMPLDLFKERWIYLRGRVNGRETDLLLDSGAGMSVLDRAFAQSAGLEAAGAVAARGTGGVTEAGMVEGVTLDLGGLRMGPMAAAVIDLSEIAQKSGRTMPMILGKELFHAVVVDVDYPGKRIRFHDPARFRYAGPGRSTELLPGEDGHKSVRLQMEGGEPVVVGLDTGQGGALTVFGHYAEERGFLAGRPLSEAKSGGVGGFRISKTGTLRSVTLAGFEIPNVPVTFHTENLKGAFDTRRQAGNLGAGLLNRFRVLFDYENARLWLEPGPASVFTEPLPRDRTGLQFEIDGTELVVVFVAPGSPAQETGWVEGERVRALDGEPVGPDWWRIVAGWMHAADGTLARLTLADGRERTLRLRAYY
ncbi:MAG: aspartyl protease family protein [Thermoanaerobaculia bacterium]|jgi:hypothetical protein|nr:aspartyl protease family protein [Thermoanaerobaculia bacterium]